MVAKENTNKIKVKINNGENEAEAVKKSAERKEKIREERERDSEINESLSRIYEDGAGNKGNSAKLKIVKKRGFIFWFFNFLIFGLFFIFLGLGAYYYFFHSNASDSSSVELLIEAEKAISANEEFFYVVRIKNSGYTALKNASVAVEYPENFIFLDASLRPEESVDNSWNLGRISPRSESEIRIKGKIIDKPKESAIILARLSYTPENFSSVFEKEASFNLLIKDFGFEVVFDSPKTVLVDEEAVIVLNFKSLENNFLDEFFVKMEAEDNFLMTKTILNEGADAEKNRFSLNVSEVDKGKKIWQFAGLAEKEEKFEIRFKIKEKISDIQKLKFYFYKEEAVPADEDGGKTKKNFDFFEKEIALEIMKSDLNLILILNGSQSDQTANFEEELNYSIAYSNKGEADMNDVSIMMVLSSDFLNWASLSDKNSGKERGNMITWTGKEIPALEKIKIGDSGTIDFSINVLPFSENDLGKNFQVKSYAQYSVGSLEKFGQVATTAQDDLSEDFDNRSNNVIVKINSDLKIKEEIRYFDENNMPVGAGPLPPQVGEKSVFKVYWRVNNNLHELKDAQVETVLPEGVFWDEKSRTSVGNIFYDEENRKVVWQIGRLPITVFRADAEFNISITPSVDDRNKIMVLSSGVKATAVDTKTEDAIEKTTEPKTTKLEDDDIAGLSSDGRVK